MRVGVIDGVAGVGKSALLSAFAEAWSARHPGGRVHHAGVKLATLGGLVDDLRRALGSGPAPSTLDDDERCADLAFRLDQSETLLLIDDVHKLAPHDRERLVSSLAMALRTSTAVMTSRERTRPAEGDTLEVHLGGLSDDAAQTLWRSLDELYGPAEGFAAAKKRARGNPFVLRRAHAGDLDGTDPVGSALVDLSSDALVAARALALSDDRLQPSAFVGILPPERARAALAELSRKLIVDVDGAQSAGLHDLFREHLLAGATPADLVPVHQALAAHVIARGEGTDAEVARLTRQAARHLVESGDFDAASQLLDQRGPRLVRVGATPDLLALVDSIPKARRSPEVELTRARSLIRMLRVDEGLSELKRLAGDRRLPQKEVRYSFASSSVMVGHTALGLSAFAELLADPEAPSTLREQVTLAYSWALTSAGEGELGRRLLREAQKNAASQADAALFAFYRAVSLWSDDRIDEVTPALAEAGTLDPGAAPLFGASNHVPPMLAAILARLGRLDEARRYREMADAPGAGGEDLQGRLQAMRMQGVYFMETGEHARAVALLSEAATRYERGGNLASALTTRVGLGRALLALGSEREAMQILDDTAHRAASVALFGIAASAGRAKIRGASTRVSVAIDARAHELRFGATVVSLKDKPTLRLMLYAMARKPGETHPKDALAKLLWGDRYHPLRHDNAFWVNMRRLRKLLEGSGVAVEHLDEGYRLVVPEGFVWSG